MWQGPIVLTVIPQMWVQTSLFIHLLWSFYLKFPYFCSFTKENSSLHGIHYNEQVPIASAEYSLHFSTRMLVSLSRRSKSLFKIMKMTSMYSYSDFIDISTTSKRVFARTSNRKRVCSEKHSHTLRKCNSPSVARVTLNSFNFSLSSSTCSL